MMYFVLAQPVYISRVGSSLQTRRFLLRSYLFVCFSYFGVLGSQNSLWLSPRALPSINCLPLGGIEGSFYYRNVAIELQSSAYVECIVTKQLQIGSRSFHCQADQGLYCQRGKFENELRRGSLRSGTQLMLGQIRTLPKCTYCTLHTYIRRHITFGQPKPIIVVAVCAINTQ